MNSDRPWNRQTVPLGRFDKDGQWAQRIATPSAARIISLAPPAGRTLLEVERSIQIPRRASLTTRIERKPAEFLAGLPSKSRAPPAGERTGRRTYPGSRWTLYGYQRGPLQGRGEFQLPSSKLRWCLDSMTLRPVISAVRPSTTRMTRLPRRFSAATT